MPVGDISRLREERRIGARLTTWSGAIDGDASGLSVNRCSGWAWQGLILVCVGVWT